MGGKYPSRFYDDATLRLLEEAFREVWTTVRDVGGENDEMLGQKIAQILMHLVDQGIANPDELRVRTLRNLQN
jgi:hypothetical protein